MKILQLLCAATLLCLLSVSPALAQATDMTFFLTSVGSGNGADLGGLSGADAHCQSLAAAVEHQIPREAPRGEHLQCREVELSEDVQASCEDVGEVQAVPGSISCQAYGGEVGLPLPEDLQ